MVASCWVIRWQCKCVHSMTQPLVFWRERSSRTRPQWVWRRRWPTTGTCCRQKSTWLSSRFITKRLCSSIHVGGCLWRRFLGGSALKFDHTHTHTAKHLQHPRPVYISLPLSINVVIWLLCYHWDDNTNQMGAFDCKYIAIITLSNVTIEITQYTSTIICSPLDPSYTRCLHLSRPTGLGYVWCIWLQYELLENPFS